VLLNLSWTPPPVRTRCLGQPDPPAIDGAGHHESNRPRQEAI